MSGLKTSFQSAPGPMLGYLFQVERALLWLSKAASDGTVSIETDDDLVIHLKDDSTLSKYYEQDKSAALSTRNPFSNKSKDLWKTLKIWSTNIISGVIDVDKAYFLLVTNKTIGSCLIRKVLNSKSNATELVVNVDNLVKQAMTSGSDEIREYAKVVSGLDPTIRLKLFSNMELLDLSYTHARDLMKKDIKDNLHVSEEMPFHSIFKELLGWLTDNIIEKWVSGELAIVKGSELNKYFMAIVAKYNGKPFIERAKDVLPVKDSERGVHRGDNFVKQLDWIELDEKDILKAIDDFIRARWERSRFALEGNIPCKGDFDKMHEDLYERWVNLQRPIARNCKNEEEKKDRGYDLYWLIMDHKARLANYDTEQFYTTKGAYHLMANDFKLGWHIDWEKLKEQE
jgi:hypothetical protein